MTFVLPRQRRSDFGKLRRLIVNISSKPSRRLPGIARRRRRRPAEEPCVGDPHARFCGTLDTERQEQQRTQT